MVQKPRGSDDDVVPVVSNGLDNRIDLAWLILRPIEFGELQHITKTGLMVAEAVNEFGTPDVMTLLKQQLLVVVG